MPRRNYRRRTIPPSRPRNHKRYGKKYGRRRWKNKRFANNTNALQLRPSIAARMLRIKLPWVQAYATSVSTSSSSFLALQGNGIVPYTAGGQTGTNNVPAAGDIYPAGVLEYSQFYDKYFVNGSTINIECVSTNSQALATSPLIRAVLLAVPFTTYAGGGDDNWKGVIDQLNNYTYNQLLAWQYAKWRMIGSNTGGASRLVFKMFRKTRSMCGIKDVRDNNQFSGKLPDGSLVIGTDQSLINPEYGFMYFLKFFNADATTAATLQITIRMKLYITMTNREFNPVQTIIANP